MALWSLTPYNRYNSLFDWPSERYWNSWDPFMDALDLVIPAVSLARLGTRGGQEGGDHPSGPLVKNDDNNFTVKMDVSNFVPEEIQVKAVDDYLVVHGKHEERKDNHGYVKREFTRRYLIPQDCQADKLASSLSPNGILTIQAPKKQLQIEGQNARPIPITMEQNTNEQINHESSKK